MSHPSLMVRPAVGLSMRPASARRLALACDDELACAAWRRNMAGESLNLVDWPGNWAADQPAPAALVLFMARSLTDQLGRLRELRSCEPNMPLVVVGHALRELDQVLALEMGADDVLDANLGAPVVAAKLRALWRRMGAETAVSIVPESLQFGALHLQHAQRRVVQAGRPVGLTEGEFELLWILALRAGQTVLRADLLRQLRGLRDVSADRSIDCRIYRIRAKLGEHVGGPQWIRTIRNRGYLFAADVS